MVFKISIDSGKHSTKYCYLNSQGKLVRERFRTRVSSETGFESMGGKDMMTVTYDGQTYVVGDYAEGVTAISNSKKDNIHKLCMLTAIAKVCPSGATVHVSIGCPLSEYSDAAKRQEYRDYVLPKGRVSMTVNGKDTYFYIEKRYVVAESACGVILDNSKFGSGPVGIIDIGGLNINCASYLDGRFVASTCFTAKLGSLEIINDLRVQLNQKYDLSIPEWQLDKIVELGYVPGMEKETKKYVTDFFSGHIQKILSECRAHHWEPRTMSLIFVGGTSLLLKKQILENVPGAYIPKDADYCNVLAFYKIVFS